MEFFAYTEKHSAISSNDVVEKKVNIAVYLSGQEPLVRIECENNPTSEAIIQCGFALKKGNNDEERFPLR